MRRKDREITDRKKIEAILDKAPVCRIGFSKDNDPYVVPVCFGYGNGSASIRQARTESSPCHKKKPAAALRWTSATGLSGTKTVLVGDALPKCDRVWHRRYPY